MAYEKQNFINGTVLDADHLNKIEDQILLNEELINDKADINHVHDDVLTNSGGLEIIDARGADFDMNTLFTSGAHCKIYKTNQNTLNTPYQLVDKSYFGARILSLTSSETYGKQVAYTMGGATFERRLYNGTIGDWIKICNVNDVENFIKSSIDSTWEASY